jgi:hypothetical protein
VNRHDEANSRFSQFCVKNFPDDLVSYGGVCCIVKEAVSDVYINVFDDRNL